MSDQNDSNDSDDDVDDETIYYADDLWGAALAAVVFVWTVFPKLIEITILPQFKKIELPYYSGGPQVTDLSHLSEFAVSLSFEKITTAFTQHEHTGLLSLIVLLLTIQGIISLIAIQSDDGNKTKTITDVMAYALLPLSWMINNEAVGICLLLAALVIVGRKKRSATDWYLSGPLSMLVVACLIIILGPEYLTWETTGSTGLYRIMMHWAVTGHDSLYIVPETIKIIISVSLLAGNPSGKNTLGISFVWMVSAFMAALLGEIPNSQYVGSFWKAGLNETQYYVIFCVMTSLSLLAWDTFFRDENDGLFLGKLVALLMTGAIGIALWLPQMIPKDLINLSLSLSG